MHSKSLNIFCGRLSIVGVHHIWLRITVYNSAVSPSLSHKVNCSIDQMLLFLTITVLYHTVIYASHSRMVFM